MAIHGEIVVVRRAFILGQCSAMARIRIGPRFGYCNRTVRANRLR